MRIAIRRHDWVPAIRALPADQAVAAIGDVHGQDDLFEALSAALSEDMDSAAERTLVQLGDMVDRGPGAIAALRRARDGFSGVRSVTLMGNHEDRMLKALGGDPDETRMWIHFDGDDVLAEVGIRTDDPYWRERFAKEIGQPLIDWIATRPQLFRMGPLVFVHAGLDPDEPLDQQTPHTLMWTRRPWLESAGPYAENVAVIHGHTPQRSVDLSHPHRINLDTGAFRTGLLSALLIHGDRMRVVQAARG